MSQVSAVLRKIEGGYMHRCPACEGWHMIATDEPFPNGARWSFDGNFDAPTFSPSIRVSYNGPDADQVRVSGKRAPSACCHYFIKAGRIEFCADSTHRLAGQTVPLPPLPAEETDQ